MKIEINNKPEYIKEYFKGKVKIDVSELDEIASIETYDFEIECIENEQFINWIDEKPKMVNISNLENNILKEFYKLKQ